MARKQRRRGSSRLTLGLWIFGTGVFAAALAAAGLALKAEHKLSTLVLGGLGERFSTRVWSAPFPVHDGARLGLPRLLERLDRLGYHRVDGPASKGQYRWNSPQLDLGLRDYHAPTSSQSEGLYSLTLDDSGAWRLKDGLGNPVTQFLLEPELAAQLSGAQRVRRDPLAYEDIPKSLRDAVVAAEDKRFWTHHGLDPYAILRAAWANLRGRDLQGASTITQQLTKNLFLSPRRTLTRKIAEATLALLLELRIDKKKILTLYLNQIYMGQDGSTSVMGMRAATRYYFSKDPADLTLAQSAALAGLIRGPGYYSPFRNLAACCARRDWVLKRMREDGLISENVLHDALSEPLNPVRTASTQERRDNAYYISEVVHELIPRYGADVLYRNGLSIYTAMDPVLQSLAQKTARAAPQQAALVAMNPATGDVLALVGGRDFGASQFNRATQATRQPGSAFKPLVYAAALKLGLTPATILRDEPKVYSSRDGDWSPSNYDGVYYGTATMREALTHSLNAATLDLAQRLGIKRIQEFAREAGISSPLRNDLGLVLGASEVGPLELVSAYEPFAAAGQRASPRLVTAVLDAEGGVLEAPPPQSTVVMSPAIAYLMTSLMGSVVKEGTARSLKSLGFDRPAAGKTGTTNDGRDAWFVGYTTSLLAGVWTGADDNRALRLTGAKDALPLWAKFMKDALANYPAEEFVRPNDVVSVRICTESGMIARSGCPKKIDEFFLAGTEPVHECPLHRGGFMGWFERLTQRRKPSRRE